MRNISLMVTLFYAILVDKHSYVWFSISQAIDTLLSGYFWRLSNGNYIRPLEDKLGASSPIVLLSS